MDHYPMISKERKRELSEKIKGKTLPLPPEISCRKEPLPTGNPVYIFHHERLGDLGRLLISQNGEESQFNFELLEGGDDPSMNKIKEAFEPIAHEVGDFMESILGKGKGTMKPYESPSQAHNFAAESIECTKCGECVAFIVYAPPNATEGVIEDYARWSLAKAREFNVPTWVISEKNETLFHNQSIHQLLSLKIFPERRSIETILGTEMDEMLCPLVEKHC